MVKDKVVEKSKTGPTTNKKFTLEKRNENNGANEAKHKEDIKI
jgi:hypothetical protein